MKQSFHTSLPKMRGKRSNRRVREEERREREVARRLAALQDRITAWVLETFPDSTVEEREEEVREMVGRVWGRIVEEMRIADLTTRNQLLARML